MESSNSLPKKPPLYKEILVALIVGVLFGAIVGWFVGTFVTFFATAVADDTRQATRGMRMSAFLGGMLGIPLGSVIGLVVSLPLRLLSARVFGFLKNPWLAAPLGAAIGGLFALLILIRWYPSAASAVYFGLHSIAVGGIVAVVTVLAKPKWL
ncbi:MAG TPA: hypothetical protein VN643_16030 [Pyrinomonadaceae bacterium]|nr:hypothetical protein [Pyrinomonadaceae bacterium]